MRAFVLDARMQSAERHNGSWSLARLLHHFSAGMASGQRSSTGTSSLRTSCVLAVLAHWDQDSWVTSSNGRGCPILMASGPLLEPSWLTSEWPRCHVSNARCLCSMFHHLRKAHIQYLGIICIYIYIRI